MKYSCLPLPQSLRCKGLNKFEERQISVVKTSAISSQCSTPWDPPISSTEGLCRVRVGRRLWSSLLLLLWQCLTGNFLYTMHYNNSSIDHRQTSPFGYLFCLWVQAQVYLWSVGSWTWGLRHSTSFRELSFSMALFALLLLQASTLIFII